MHKIICQVLIDRPKRQLIIGLFLLLLGFSWFSGGPIKEALAQSPSTCQSVEILPKANEPAVGEGGRVRSVNVNALNVKLTCKEIVNVWKTLLGATDIVVALYLIAIAVATIFHIQYDTYSIKKTLPPLIVGVILANFSLFITRVMVDFASVLSVTFINAEGGQAEFLKKLIEGIYGNFGSTIGAYINASAQDTPLEAFGVMFRLFKFLGGAVGLVLAIPLFFIGLIFTLVPAILIFFLALLFYARYYIVIALAVVSPLAFICLAFPPTQKYFQRWWQEAIKWVFMLPVSMFLLWLAIQMTKLVAGGNASIGSYLISIIFLYLAIKVPFGMGNIMGVDIGGKLGGMAKLASAGVVGAGVWAGWKGMAYGVGRLRARSGVAEKEAAVKRKHADAIGRQIKDKFAGTHEALEEFRGKKRPVVAQYKEMYQTHKKDYDEYKRLNTQYRRAQITNDLPKATEAKTKMDEILNRSPGVKELLDFQERLKGEEVKGQYREHIQELRKKEQQTLFGGDENTRKDILEKLQQALQMEDRAKKEKNPQRAATYRESAKGFLEEAKRNKGYKILSGLREKQSGYLEEEKNFKAKQERLAKYANALGWMHLPGMVEALKTRGKLAREFGDKELKKTNMYRKLAGPFFQQDAGYAAFESVRHFTPEQAAQFLNSSVLEKIDKHLYDTPEKLAELLRDIVYEAPQKMLQYLRDHTAPGQKINDFEWGGAQRAAELSLRYLGGRPDLRDEFSRSLQATKSIGGDPEVISEYIKAGGATGLAPISPQNWNREAARTIGNIIAQQIEDIDPTTFTDELMNRSIGRITVREGISAQTLNLLFERRTGKIGIARDNLETVINMESSITDKPQARKDIETAVKEAVVLKGANARPEDLQEYLSRLGYPIDPHSAAMKDLVDGYRTYHQIAEMLALKQNPMLTSDREQIKNRVKELMSVYHGKK